MKKAAVSCLMAALFAWSVFSQTVNICGKVTDPAGNPLTHTVVRLGQATQDYGFGPMPYMVNTDANGQYQLGTGACPPTNVLRVSKAAHGGAYPKPVYMGGKVLFSVLPVKAWVKMSMYDLAGRFVRDVLNSTLTRGNYSGSIDTRGISSQYYLLRVTINGATNVLKFRPLSRVQGATLAQNEPDFQARLEKVAAVVDTLHVTEPGYSIGVTPIDTLVGHYDFVLTKTTSWTGDKASIAAFWGDTSTYPKNFQYIILNRTNGAWPDSKVCWGGTRLRFPRRIQSRSPARDSISISIPPIPTADILIFSKLTQGAGCSMAIPPGWTDGGFPLLSGSIPRPASIP